METNQRLFFRMRIIINPIAVVSLIVQFAYSALNILSLNSPVTLNEILYNDLLIVALPCSDIIVVIFLLLYNFNYKFLRNRIINVFFLVIGILALYIHAFQLFVLNDLILISIVLSLIDSIVIVWTIKNIRSKQKWACYKKNWFIRHLEWWTLILYKENTQMKKNIGATDKPCAGCPSRASQLTRLGHRSPQGLSVVPIKQFDLYGWNQA